MGKQVSRAAADAEKQAQEARAKKYGIAIKAGGAVTKPSEFADVPDDDFADPVNYRYPMKDKAHADNAASRWGDASNREQYSAQEQAIIGKRIEARQRSFGEQDDGEDKGERTMGVDAGLPATDRDVQMYFPITRAADKDGLLVVRGQCTSDAVDSYRTIFDYESSKRAMARWPGNVREQHDDKKAVGRRITWIPDNDNKRIILEAGVSRAGAPDTCAKIEQGILTGFSVKLKPGYKVKLVQRDGQTVPMYYDFDYAEISLVDVPGSPGCNIEVVRADGSYTDVLAEVAERAEAQEDVSRAGAAVSADRMNQMHAARDSALMSARQMTAACPCDECAAMLAALDPDNDGDVDLPGVDSELDPDDDAEDMAERVVAAVERRLAPALSRYQAIAGDMAATLGGNGTVTTLEALHTDEGAVERALAPLQAQLALLAQLPDLAKILTSIQETVSRMAKQPAPGGPALRAPDKRLATDPQQGAPEQDMDRATVVRRATEMGLISPAKMTPQQQVTAAAAFMRPINE